MILENESTGGRVHGFGFGEHIQLRDEFGTVWKGSAETGSDHAVHYTLRDEQGRTISGVANQYGIVLRDAKGKTWRGIIDA